MVRFSFNINLPIYMLVGKYQIKFGQKVFASPKICTPVHLWLYETQNNGSRNSK